MLLIFIKFIPVLAKEGIKHEVGGRGMRGGLLVVDSITAANLNALQLLAGMSTEHPIRSNRL